MSGRLVEVERCQICGSDQAATVFTENPYRVRRCECTFVYVSPRYCDDTIHKVYDADYWNSDSPKTKGYADYAAEGRLYLKTFRRRMAFVRRHCPAQARVLDIGCAAGYFLRVMREAGHDVYGVEVSEAIATRAIEQFGADRIHVGTIASAPPERFGKHSFDLVTMWDVIEHVPDPQALLDHAREMLKPDGRLIIETQNVDSRFASVLGKRWHHYKHEEHIYHFNPATIRALLEQRGFAVDEITTAYAGKYVSLGFIAERAGRVNGLLSVLLKPLALMRRANLYLNLRDEIVVVSHPGDAAHATPSANDAMVGSTD